MTALLKDAANLWKEEMKLFMVAFIATMTEVTI